MSCLQCLKHSSVIVLPTCELLMGLASGPHSLPWTRCDGKEYTEQDMHLQALCSKADRSKGLAHIYIMPHIQKLSPVAAALHEGHASAAWQIPDIMAQHLLSTQVFAAALEQYISRTVTQVSRCICSTT